METVKYAKEITDAVHDAGWQAGVLAGQAQVISDTITRLTEMIEVDYNNPFDDTRGLIALRGELEARLAALNDAAPTATAGSPG